MLRECCVLRESNKNSNLQIVPKCQRVSEAPGEEQSRKEGKRRETRGNERVEMKDERETRKISEREKFSTMQTKS